MTEKKLNSIYDDLVDKYDGELSYDFVLEAMKQAVNEALEEIVSNTDQFDHIHKDEILNLKVK